MVNHKSINLISLIGLIFLTGVAVFGRVYGFRQNILIPAAEITSENGVAYTTVLPASRFLLLNNLGDSLDHPNQSKTELFENAKPLELAHNLHDDIRHKGRGRFSHWESTLYFSTSDNSDPRVNGRAYSVVITNTPSIWILGVLIAGLLVSLYFNRQLFGNSFQYFSNTTWFREKISSTVRLGIRWLFREVLPGVLITIILLVVLMLGGEVFLRINRPFVTTTWPNYFDEQFGFTFIPGSTVNLTNHLDFWASTQANSIGFLEREPPTYKHSDVCRIVFIGDSFVEAAQVPIEKKFHVLFENMAGKQLSTNRQLETVALGYSGTGQANQLPFYDIFARSLQPDVVVLAFVSNDFANNSNVLESIRNGWHPNHSPRLFFEYSKNLDEFKPIPIDATWQDFVLPSLSVENTRSQLITWLEDNSYLYNWLYARFFKNSKLMAVQQFTSWLNGRPPLSDIYHHRRDEIEKLEGFSDVFRNWPAEDVNIDEMFGAQELPPVFEEAILIAGHVFDEFLQRSRDDGFHLLVLITDSVQFFSPGQYKRVEKLLADRNIPYINQYDYIMSNGGDPRKGRFDFDGHWNEQGHQWAAQALLQYFQAHTEICES